MPHPIVKVMMKPSMMNILILIACLLVQLSSCGVLPPSHHGEKGHRISSTAKDRYNGSLHSVSATGNHLVERQNGGYGGYSVVIPTTTAITLNGKATSLVLPPLPHSTTTVTVAGYTFAPGPCTYPVWYRVNPTSTTYGVSSAASCTGSMWVQVTSTSTEAAHSAILPSEVSTGTSTSNVAIPPNVSSPGAPSQILSSVNPSLAPSGTTATNVNCNDATGPLPASCSASSAVSSPSSTSTNPPSSTEISSVASVSSEAPTGAPTAEVATAPAVSNEISSSTSSTSILSPGTSTSRASTAPSISSEVSSSATISEISTLSVKSATGISILSSTANSVSVPFASSASEASSVATVSGNPSVPASVSSSATSPEISGNFVSTGSTPKASMSSSSSGTAVVASISKLSSFASVSSTAPSVPTKSASGTPPGSTVSPSGAPVVSKSSSAATTPSNALVPPGGSSGTPPASNKAPSVPTGASSSTTPVSTVSPSGTSVVSKPSSIATASSNASSVSAGGSSSTTPASEVSSDTSIASEPSSVATSLNQATPISTGSSSINPPTSAGIPSDDSVVSVTSVGRTFLQTFVPTTYSQYTTLTGPITITTVIAGTSIPIIVGSGGVGWQLPVVSSGEPRAPAPSSLPLPIPVSSGTKSSTAASCPAATGVIGFTVVEITTSGKTYHETFVATTYPQYCTLKVAITTVTVVHGSTLPIVVGPDGVGWQLPTLSSGEPRASEPVELPGLSASSTTPKSSSSTAKPSTGAGVTSTGSITSTSSSSLKSSSSSSSTTSLCFTTCTIDGPECNSLPLCTYTITDLSTSTTATVTGVTSNTEISGGSSGGGGGGGGGGSTSCVPFLWRCWFCNLIGMFLNRIPCLPGIYKIFPPPFPNFPLITIGLDHIPTVGPSNGPTNEPTSEPTGSSSSSEKCTTKTVSDCAVQCTASPTVVSGTTSYSSACKTTCSQTVGCSATQTTTTSKTTTSSNSTDAIITLATIENGPPLSSEDPNMAQYVILANAFFTSSLRTSFPLPTFKSTYDFPLISTSRSSSSSKSSSSASATWGCTNPSLEDGDGLCTCMLGASTVGTYTPSGGPGNSCPTAMPMSAKTRSVSTSKAISSSKSSSVVTTSKATTTSSAAFECSNPSLEDGDGLCTCMVGASTVGTYTPSGGPGNSCPTVMPGSKSSSSSKSSSTPSKTTSAGGVQVSSHFGNISCNVPDPAVQNLQFKYFSQENATNAVRDFCLALAVAQVQINETHPSITQLIPDAVRGGYAEGTAYLNFKVEWSLAGCADVNNATGIEFETAFWLPTCIETFQHCVDDCPLITRPPVTSNSKTGASYDFWKIGGTFYSGCAYWNIAALP